MSAEAILSGIAAAREIIEAFTRQAVLLNAVGAVSDEELAEIREEAEISDTAWDMAVEDARDRLEQDG